MSKRWSTLHKAIENLGLDWFALLLGRPVFEDAPLPFPATFSEIREEFSGLRGGKLDDAVEYCGKLLDREEDRSEKIESKAFTLIGITGIATGFITGFAGLLLDQDKITGTWILILAAMLYILVVVSLMWTIFLAVKVVTVGDYWFTYPAADDIFQLSSVTLTCVKQERAASLFYSFAQNQKVINRKATFLSGAQIWFRNSIVLLLALTLLLALYVPFKSSSSSGVPVPTTGPTTTPQLSVPATDTPGSTSTQTVIIATKTPTIVLPTSTSAAMPATSPPTSAPMIYSIVATPTP